jgi:hypothetical protein
MSGAVYQLLTAETRNIYMPNLRFPRLWETIRTPGYLPAVRCNSGTKLGKGNNISGVYHVGSLGLCIPTLLHGGEWRLASGNGGRLSWRYTRGLSCIYSKSFSFSQYLSLNTVLPYHYNIHAWYSRNCCSFQPCKLIGWSMLGWTAQSRLIGRILWSLKRKCNKSEKIKRVRDNVCKQSEIQKLEFNHTLLDFHCNPRRQDSPGL